MTVIVDVQTKFELADTVIKPCVAEIKKARKKGETIVLVDFKNEGFIYDEIMDASCGYPYRIFAQKSINNGASAIYRSFYAKKGLPEFNTIKVCGIYTSHCVRETAGGLAGKFPHKKVEVLMDACACFEDEDKLEKFILKSIKKHPNLSFVFKNP